MIERHEQADRIRQGIQELTTWADVAPSAFRHLAVQEIEQAEVMLQLVVERDALQEQVAALTAERDAGTKRIRRYENLIEELEQRGVKGIPPRFLRVQGVLKMSSPPTGAGEQAGDGG